VDTDMIMFMEEKEEWRRFYH